VQAIWLGLAKETILSPYWLLLYLCLDMHILSKGTLRDYWLSNANSKGVLEAWHKVVKSVIWNTPNDVIKMFPRASIIANSRVVFRLLGNDLRLIVVVDYKFKKVFVRFIGTHAEYDKIDAKTI